MEFRDLTIFTTVAKIGSVTKAAERLGYVQSNITARIQHLETELGTTLFHRHARGMSLTSSGVTLLRYAEQILRLCHEAEQAVQDTISPTGPLRIGAMETTTATRLPAILAEYHRQCPQVDLSLTTGPTDQLLQAVLSYDIEAAFVAGPVCHPLLNKAAVIEEELVLVAEANGWEPSHSHLYPTTVVAFRQGCSYRKRLEQYLDNLGIQSHKVIELGTLDGILGCVAAGLGISLVPRTIIDGSRYDLAVYEVPEEFRKAPTVLVHRKDALISPALGRFIHTVKQLTGQLERAKGNSQD
ncbi:MAG: LysR family transcriptional regulator [Alicyclobacillus macrosporangiidus]|uniref:LysR family transcriptional regulator n=1 Tax=Alicyclobacillus macrosporangiidus TaxID=392015 RepID=UPI0026F23845|nr:LysR family transcriptional regulator [Alicyclobacillus macrosporangiidus]MCL6600888.1 LysR family transcriptional regulator [Alicyclobacillus macrosporangiidus]